MCVHRILSRPTPQPNARTRRLERFVMILLENQQRKHRYGIHYIPSDHEDLSVELQAFVAPSHIKYYCTREAHPDLVRSSLSFHFMHRLESGPSMASKLYCHLNRHSTFMGYLLESCYAQTFPPHTLEGRRILVGAGNSVPHCSTVPLSSFSNPPANGMRSFPRRTRK